MENQIEIEPNTYQFDKTENISSVNSAWFALKASLMDDQHIKYRLNEGDIVRIGRITTRIKEIKFQQDKNIEKNNEISINTNLNLKEMNTIKTIKSDKLIERNKGLKNNNMTTMNTEGINFKKQCPKYSNNENELNLNGTIQTSLSKSKIIKIGKFKEKKQKTCRICYVEEDDGENNPLVQPCICAGTMKYIHLGCLKQWLSTRSCVKIDGSDDCSIFLVKQVECELCKTKLPDYIRHNQKLYEVLDFRSEFDKYLTLESLNKTVHRSKNAAF